MTFQNTVTGLSPEVVARMREALELGKWPDGQTLTPEQKQTTMEAVLAWEAVHLAPEERTGYIPPRGTRSTTSNERVPLRMIGDDDER